MKLNSVQTALRKFASPKKARNSTRFFKTGPGQYGEGDIFIGATTPELNAVAKKFFDSSPATLIQLLASPIHEDRSVALQILVQQYTKAKTDDARAAFVKFYLANKAGINNWDLVDTSAYKILGDYCLRTGDTKPISKLATSLRHWDRRIAMVASLAFIRAEKLEVVYILAKGFLGDHEDLMHKATGWMLREAGKRDLARLRKFISTHGKKMPRTMLRYSIEKMSAAERKKILQQTK
jgi:3-methyladenine DNA glycosylase AlkD